MSSSLVVKFVEVESKGSSSLSLPSEHVLQGWEGPNTLFQSHLLSFSLFIHSHCMCYRAGRDRTLSFNHIYSFFFSFHSLSLPLYSYSWL